jgi:hypothetical protein
VAILSRYCPLFPPLLLSPPLSPSLTLSLSHPVTLPLSLPLSLSITLCDLHNSYSFESALFCLMQSFETCIYGSFYSAPFPLSNIPFTPLLFFHCNLDAFELKRQQRSLGGVLHRCSKVRNNDHLTSPHVPLHPLALLYALHAFYAPPTAARITAACY